MRGTGGPNQTNERALYTRRSATVSRCAVMAPTVGIGGNHEDRFRMHAGSSDCVSLLFGT